MKIRYLAEDKKKLGEQVKFEFNANKENSKKIADFKIEIEQKTETAHIERNAKIRSDREAQQYRTQNQNLAEENKKITAELLKLKTENENLEKRLVGVEKNVKDGGQLAEKYQDLEEELRGKEVLVDSLRDTISNLEEIIETNEESYASEKYLEKEIFSELQMENDELVARISVYEKKIGENSGLVENLGRSESRCAELDAKVLELENEKIQIQNETTQLIEKVKADNSYKDTMIDKQFIGSFLVNYFDFEEDLAQKVQVLETMSSILDFTDEQKAKIGLRVTAMTEVVDARKEHADTEEKKDPESKGFTDKFMSFLLGDED